MKKFKITMIFLMVLSLSFAANVSAALINFETVPGGTPSDALAISNQYQSVYGVTFSWSNGTTTGTPFLEATGDDQYDGFLNNGNGGWDQEATGYVGDLGNFFLRLGDGDLPGAGTVGALRIDYNSPVSAASAEIWDIDWAGSQGTEQWQVQAFNSSGSIVGTLTSPLGDDMNLDGKPWTWSFNLASDQIDHIEISFTGSKTNGIGLAFDNFETGTAAVPIPGAVWLLGSGLLGLLGVRRRRLDG